jgi:hypothetical protein
MPPTLLLKPPPRPITPQRCCYSSHHQDIIEALRPSREDNKAVDELFFLMGLNVNAHGESVNHVANQREWQDILATARANGWKPLGTILNYEYQYQLKASH